MIRLNQEFTFPRAVELMQSYSLHSLVLMFRYILLLLLLLLLQVVGNLLKYLDDDLMVLNTSVIKSVFER